MVHSTSFVRSRLQPQRTAYLGSLKPWLTLYRRSVLNNLASLCKLIQVGNSVSNSEQQRVAVKDDDNE